MATKGLFRVVPQQSSRSSQQAVTGNASQAEVQRPTAVGILSAADLRVDMLSCKICLGHYNTTDQRPRSLVCQHTFCERCIRECLTKPSRVKCPMCRTRTRLVGSQDGVHKLPINMTAVELARQQQQTAPKVTAATRTDQDSGFEIHHRVVAKPALRLHPQPNAPDLDLSQHASSSNARQLDSDDEDLVPAFTHQLHPYSSNAKGLLQQKLDQDFSAGLPNVHSHTGSGADIVSNASIQPQQQQQLLAPSAVYAGRFGRYQDADNQDQTSNSCSYRPGTFCNPTSIACSPPSQPIQQLPNRIAVTDRATSVIQIFAENGDYLSAFQMPGVVCACFVAATGGADVDQCRLAVATASAILICDQLGRAEKTIPVTDVVAIATYRRGFVAACGNRLMMCDQLVPTVTMASVKSVIDRRPGTKSGLGTSHSFRRIVDVATSSGYEPVGKDKLYILDLSAVYVVDASTLTLRGLVQLNESDVVTGLPRHPVSVQVDPATGHVIISDSDSNTVEEYNPDSGRLTRCLIRIGLENGLPAPGACGHMTVVPTRPTGGFGGFRISLLHLLFCGPGLAEVRMYRV